MTEIKVVQRSEEWFKLRQGVQLTASMFGDAIGVGQGKPFDFLKSLIFTGTDEAQQENSNTTHGQAYEPIIDEVYQLLSGQRTENSGFWIPNESNPLHGMIGASPDGKVFHGSTENSSKCIGLVEYKAPIHGIYDQRKHPPHGIPRKYMAQIQGQMAVCRKPWCDFMAVCASTKEIMLKRVHYSHVYWTAVATKIKKFATVLKEAKARQMRNVDPLLFADAQILAHSSMQTALFPGEREITVQELLQRDTLDRFRCEGGPWLSFEFLVGDVKALQAQSLSPWKIEMQILKIDRDIKDKRREVR